MLLVFEGVVVSEDDAAADELLVREGLAVSELEPDPVRLELAVPDRDRLRLGVVLAVTVRVEVVEIVAESVGATDADRLDDRLPDELFVTDAEPV